MAPPDVQRSLSAIRCEECRSTVRSGGRQALSFLLVDRLTVPVLSCEEHLERFASICELTVEDGADLLHHRPAGGLPCPGCRLAPYSSSHPVIRVQDGAIVPMACPEHQSEIAQRYRTGLETRQRLTTGLDAHTDPSP